MEAMELARRTWPGLGDGGGAPHASAEMPPEYQAELMKARLPRFLDRLLQSTGARGSVALVDGGVETVVRGTRRQCLMEILKAFVLPWHGTSNPIYVWGD
jgi:hypothetical protein